MATSVNGRAGLWLDGVTWAANDLRLELAAALLTSASSTGTTGIAAAQGVRPSVGSPLVSSWTSGMAFTLAAGTCWVQGTASATAGIYTATLDTTTTLTVPNGDPTNPRIDSVIAVITDVGTSSSTTIFKILAGTPAGSPVHPTLPANAVRLCDIAVAANASVLSAPNFTDLRPFAVALGGILPYGNAAIGTTVGGPPGTYVDDLNTGRLRRLDGSGNARQPKMAAFAPASSAAPNNSFVNGGSTTAMLSISGIVTDGSTEVVVTVRSDRIYQSSTTIGDHLLVSLLMDGSTFDSSMGTPTIYQETTNANGRPLCFEFFGTPAAGTHTFAVQYQAVGTNAWISTSLTMRVSPTLS